MIVEQEMPNIADSSNMKRAKADDVFVLQRQGWTDFIRYIFASTNTGGTVQLELYNSPRGGNHITAYVGALYVDEGYRRHGGGALLAAAEAMARQNGHDAIWLDWSLRDSPHWVFDWYARRGYDEVEFGPGSALMRKTLL